MSLPEPLVTVQYFAGPEFAKEPLEKLAAAGVTGYMKGSYFAYHGPIAIKVPESRIDEARAILGLAVGETGLEEATGQEPGELHCPLCGAPDPLPRKPFALWMLGATFLIFAGLLYLGLWIPAALAVVGGILTTMGIERSLKKWQCKACLHRWS